MLLADDCEKPVGAADYPDVACGFYWTEGMRSFGWAVDGVPPIKCGSSVGVPSPPAIRLPSGAYVTPDLRDTERLQGFPADWTAPAEEVARRGERWRMVGNSVSVPVAAWIGSRLAKPGRYDGSADLPWAGGKWSRRAAWADLDGVVHAADVGPWPVWQPSLPLVDFLEYPGKPLSARAAPGFLRRTRKGSLRFPLGFIDELTAYAERQVRASLKSVPGGDPEIRAKPVFCTRVVKSALMRRITAVTQETGLVDCIGSPEGDRNQRKLRSLMSMDTKTGSEIFWPSSS